MPPFVLLNAIPLGAPPLSLAATCLRGDTADEDNDNVDWQLGFLEDVRLLGPARVAEYNYTAPAAAETLRVRPDDTAPILPFTVWDGERDQADGNPAHEAALFGRIAERAEITWQHQVGKEFQQGIAQPTNPHLTAVLTANDHLVSASAIPFRDAIPRLAGRATSLSNGWPVWLHMPLELLTEYLSHVANCRKVDAHVEMDPLDTVLVGDSGYGHLGPANATPTAGHSWIYATSPCVIRYTAAQLPEGTYGENLNRATNLIDLRSYRLVAVTMRPEQLYAQEVIL